MNKRTVLVLSTTMMSIATAACAFCMAQTANAAENATSVDSVSTRSTTVVGNSSTNTSSNAVQDLNAASSKTTNGGGSAFDSNSVKPSENISPSKSSETAKTVETTKTTKSAVLNNSTDSNKNSITDRSVTSSTTGSSSSTTIPADEASSTIVTTADVSSSTDSQKSDDVVWEDSDFNIYYDPELGKMIGCRKNIEHPAENGKPAYTENVDVEGFSPQGFAKLKKSRHVVIPEGIQAIHENAFIGRSSGKPDNFIDTLVLPKSLKVIENGAFAYNTIRGTVEIPEGVISIGAVAFIGNKIEKVVFKSVLNGTGKINPTDTKPYYLSGVGSRAFQANKIREIVVPGNLGDFMFLFDETNPNQPDPGPFDNQNLGTKTIEVGEAFEYPIAIHQSGNNQEDIHGYGGFIENSTPTLITKSSYFELKNGKYVAKTAGTIQGQWIEYDLRNSENSPIGAAIFKYEILSKGSLCTVTFNNGDKVISTIRVKKGQSVTKGVVNDGQMPVDPVKDGYKFTGWYTQKDGKGNQFTTDTVVNADTTVYASYASKTPKPPTPAANATPTLTLQDKTITEGEQLDLKTLVVSAKDPEDGDITSKVKLTDNGGFDNTKVGSYKITFSVTDNGGATATASATVTVTKKPTPPTPPTPPEPEPTPVPELEQELEPEPAPDQPDQPEQPKQPEAKHAAKHLPQTGSDTMPILASAIASLFAGIAGLAKSFSATRKRRN